jgi:hypothetical protein
MIAWTEMIASTSELEVREISGKLPVKVVPELEEWTGADLMISPVNLPVAPALIHEHLKKGAIFVQIKRGHDLVSSILDGRMHKSLAHMQAAGAKQSQCVLLFLGQLACVRGRAVINGTECLINGEESYWQVKAALSKWWKRGGVVEELPRTSLFPEWTVMTERHLIEFAEHPKYVFMPDDRLFLPDHNDPLQELIEVKDWRRTMATFPQLGPKRLAALIEEMKKSGAQMNLLTALTWLTTRETCLKVPGFGLSMLRTARNWVGLEDGADLSVLFRLEAELKDKEGV